MLCREYKIKLKCSPFKSLTDSQLTRKAPSSYADGVYKMSGEARPSARKLSQIFMKGKDGMGSLRNRTSIATFFGKKSAVNGHVQDQYYKPNLAVIQLL